MIWVTRIRNLNRRNYLQGRLLVSVDLRTNKISATGGYRFFVHATAVKVPDGTLLTAIADQ